MPLDPTSPLARLIAQPARPGTLSWISLRPKRGAPVLIVEAAELDTARGLVGDRYNGRSGNRQVTLIQLEHLAAVGAYLGEAPVAPERLRRNLVVSGLNLLALKDKRFRIGTAELEWTGECHPCSRMEEELGPGGYNAMRGHGGITARVVTGGTVRLGDAVAAP